MLKHFRQQHRPKKNLLIVGRKAVITALEEGRELERIYLQQNAGGDTMELIRKMAADHLVPVNKVPAEKLNGFNAGDHEGCIALISRIRYKDLQQVVSFVVDRGEAPLLLILDGITDIRNIGGIARTAFCCGVHALIIADKGTGALNDDAILTSAGALEEIDVCRVASLAKAVDDLHLNGIHVFASAMKAPLQVQLADFNQPCAIIMGSEEKGISPALARQCDEAFSIPMPGLFESLNVSVATGMILYEAMRQRGFGIKPGITN